MFFDDLGGPKTPITLISYRFYNVFLAFLKIINHQIFLKIRARSKTTDLHTVSFLFSHPARNISVSVTPTAFKTRAGSKVTHLLTVSFASSDPAGNISFRGCVPTVVATQRSCISTIVTTPFSGEFPPAQRRRDLE